MVAFPIVRVSNFCRPRDTITKPIRLILSLVPLPFLFSQLDLIPAVYQRLVALLIWLFRLISKMKEE